MAGTMRFCPDRPVAWRPSFAAMLEKAPSEHDRTQRQPCLPTDAPEAARRRRREIIVSLAVFVVVLAAHATSSNRTSWDSRWTIHTALSILHHGRTDLDEYEPALKTVDYYFVDRVGGRLYNRYPIGSSLVALPFVWVVDQTGGWFGYDLTEAARRGVPEDLEMRIASILVALTSVIIYRIGRRQLGVAYSLAAAGIFALGTSAWSTASRACWGHTPTILMLSVGLWMMLRAKDRPIWAGLAAGPLALAILCRPTNLIPMALLGLYVLLRHRRQFPLFAAILLAIGAVFVAYTHATYGQWFSTYYQSPTLREESHFWEALAGQLISPNRGLLIASPILLLAPVGMYLGLRRRRLTLLEGLAAVAILLHWLVISYWPWWWGGHCQGPRLWTDMLPFMMVFVIACLAGIEQSVGGRKTIAIIAAGVLMLASFGVHWSLANRRETMSWNIKRPDGTKANVDRQPWRVWDWRDVQFLRR